MTEQLPAESKSFSLVPASYDDAIKISKTLSASKLVPKDYQGQPENVFVAIAWGQELGLAPLQSLQNIAVINGRPSIWGDAALAICMARPDFEDIEEKVDGMGEEKRVATCTIKRKGRSPVVRTFSVLDAKRAGLWGKQGPWQQYPDRMLQLRARGFALRDAFPDAMRGFHLAEEMQDVPAEIDVTPPRPTVVMPTSKAAQPAADAPVKAETVDAETGEIISNDGPSELHSFDEKGQPAATMEGQPTASEGQLRVMRSKLTGAGLTEQQLAEAFGVPTIAAITAGSVNAALNWIKNGGRD